MKSRFDMTSSPSDLPELSDAELSIIMGGSQYVAYEQLKNAGEQIQQGVNSVATAVSDAADWANNNLRVPAAAALTYVSRAVPYPPVQGAAAATALVLIATKP